MTKPVFGMHTSDWRIEVAFGATVGAGFHADASLWRFYSPHLSFCCASLATGGGMGIALGVGIDIDGVGIATQAASAAGGTVNPDLTIHRAFRAHDIGGATMSEISFGGGIGVELTARDFDVTSRHGNRLFSFKGIDAGALMGARASLLNWTGLEFNPAFEVPVSRWEALNEQRG